MFAARDREFEAVCRAADELRASVNGDAVTYVVNRNINYTNICSYHCRFCAFSKGKKSDHLRGRPYDLAFEEIERRAREAWERGATETCLQGGIHPDYTGATYVEICRAVRRAAPRIHIHAFSPLEIWSGAKTSALNIGEFLSALRAEGLGTLPGTAAEILDDEIRAIICPDKIATEQWLEVMTEAHRVGLKSTATMMFGHVERPAHWARHLLRIRALQERTGDSRNSCRCLLSTWRLRSTGKVGHDAARPFARRCSSMQWRASLSIRSFRTSRRRGSKWDHVAYARVSMRARTISAAR